MMRIPRPTSPAIQRWLLRSLIGVLVIGLLMIASFVHTTYGTRGTAIARILKKDDQLQVRVEDINLETASMWDRCKRRLVKSARGRLGKSQFAKYVIPWCDIRGIRIDDLELDDRDWTAIGVITELHSLHLSGCTWNRGAFANISKLRSLEFLQLRSTNVTDDDLKTIATLPKLRFLDLSHTSICGLWFSYEDWKSTQTLYDLNLSFTVFPWAFLSELTKFEALERLDLRNCDLQTEEYLAQMKSEGEPVEIPVFPNLEIFACSKNALGSIKDEFLSRQPKLRIVR